MINFRTLGRAAIKAWPVGVAFSGIVVCWLLSYCLASYLKEQILYSGTLLQFFGLSTVAIGISKLRRDFGKPSVFESINSWFQLVISAFRKQSPVTCEIGPANAIGSSNVLAALYTSSEMSLEMRIEALEKALSDLREQYSKSVIDLKDNLSRVETLVHIESNNRQTGDANISKLLEGFAVGGIHLELVGLAWLLLGMFGTSIPKELADLLYYVSIHSPF
jgi:hypothetical protein